MIPANVRFLPDLQYYFSIFNMTNMLDKDITYPSGQIYDVHMWNNKSFIQLLFTNEQWQHGLDYTIGYKPLTYKGSWPTSILDRLSIYHHSQYFIPSPITYRDPFYTNLPDETCLEDSTTPLDGTSRVYLCVDTTSGSLIPTNNPSIYAVIQKEDEEEGINLFNLCGCDIICLDALAHYKTNPENINVYIHNDNQPPNLTQLPGGTYLLSVNLTLLTSLSKLISIFIYTMKTGDHQYYVGDQIIGVKPIDKLFEVYVINKIFKLISEGGPDYVD